MKEILGLTNQETLMRARSDLRLGVPIVLSGNGIDAVVAPIDVLNQARLDQLTSIDKKSLKEIGFTKNLKELIQHQAKIASKAKLDAIVCSAKEVGIVRKVFKKEIITPGIRFNSKVEDQKRVLTPNQAFKNGSDWLVIGRPITKGNIKKNLDKLIDHLNQ